jgi:mRNA interferase MazF
VVISPDEMNRNLRTVMIAPITAAPKRYPTGVGCQFQARAGEIVLDQVRTVDQLRLVRKLGDLPPATAARVLRVLAEMFAP